MKQTHKITYLIERLDSNTWQTVSSEYRTIKSALRAVRRARSHNRRAQYRIAEQTEITTISVERIIKAVDEGAIA
jgi:hypothetical protein